MIIPRLRLLVWVGVWLLPLSLAGALSPAAAPVAYGLAALLMLAPAFDAVLAGRGLAGVEVGAPDLVRLTKDAEGRLEARIGNASAVARRIRLGLGLPEAVGCEDDDIEVALPAGATSATVSFRCVPARRGSYRLDRCYLGAVSPLGFFLKRRGQALATEVRVYPNLVGERRRLAAVFLTRGALGIHGQRQIGHGREFEKLREYIPGDSYSDIHWKATAKRASPVTKVFQIERTQEVYVIVDASRLSARVPEAPGAEPDPRTSSTLERCVTAALILGMVAERQGDLFGVMSFSDAVDAFVRARNGPAHYRACRDALYALQPRPVTPDFSELFTFIRMRLRRRALLVFLTSLDDPIAAESFAANIPLIARQHLVLVNMIRPAGVRPVFSDGDVGGIDDLYRDLAGHLRWRRLRELEKALHRRGVRFRLVANEAVCPQLVSQYVEIKRRQLL